MSAEPTSMLEAAAARALARQAGDADSLLEARDNNPGPPGDERDDRPSMVERFAAGLTPFTDAELEAAKRPHPHAFQQDECGLFPVGEVSVIAAPGREGKTFATVALAVSYVLGTRVVGLVPQPDREVLIYSAEDDRQQYARKVLAWCSRLGQGDAAKVRQRIVVPDLQAPGMELFQTVVAVADRQPVEALMVEAVIGALRERMDRPVPPGLVVFETASTLSEADEDNRSFRVLIRALRRIARELQLAVVLVHHTSQAASNNLSDLNVSTGDIRGATALAYNSRQNLLLVNLGSTEDPMPDSDARTVLRAMAAPTAPGRVSVLIPLDTSKAQNPPPMFFHWHSSPYGAALAITPVPAAIEGARWQKLRQMLQGQRAELKQAAKTSQQSAKIAEVVRIVRDLTTAGKQPTAKQVSVAAGRNNGWAAPYLALAVQDGELVCRQERVPRTQGTTDVYRPADWLGGVP